MQYIYSAALANSMWVYMTWNYTLEKALNSPVCALSTCCFPLICMLFMLFCVCVLKVIVCPFEWLLLWFAFRSHVREYNRAKFSCSEGTRRRKISLETRLCYAVSSLHPVGAGWAGLLADYRQNNMNTHHRANQLLLKTWHASGGDVHVSAAEFGGLHTLFSDFSQSLSDTCERRVFQLVCECCDICY